LTYLEIAAGLYEELRLGAEYELVDLVLGGVDFNGEVGVLRALQQPMRY